MDRSPLLSLPFVAAQQAQKHVTVNEALAALDALAQIAVETRTLAEPPTVPAAGTRYLVGPDGTGAWTGHDGELASSPETGWRFHKPAPGWLVHVRDEDTLLLRTADGWRPVAANAETAERLGINASADDVNRLAVSAAATLFTHEGGDHRLSVNKANATDTASLVFQSGFSGRAEMGLAGEDAWSIKASPDGETWRTGLTVDPASAVVTQPQRPVVLASLDKGAWRDNAAGTLSGFDTLALAQGFVLGDPVSGDASFGRFLVAQAGGLHHVSMRIYGDPDATFRIYLRVEPSGRRPLFAQCSTNPRQPWVQEVATLVNLEPGDRLAFEFREAGRCYQAQGRTELTAYRL